VAARLRHVAGTKWGTKKYLDTGLLQHAARAATLMPPLRGEGTGRQRNEMKGCSPAKCERSLTLPNVRKNPYVILLARAVTVESG